MQQGIDPTTGLSVWGARQAECRLFKAITTQLGSREKRRNVGGEFRKLMSLANEHNRMQAINRIHRIIANPANDLSDIVNPKVDIRIHGAGFLTRINYTYDGQKQVLEL